MSQSIKNISNTALRNTVKTLRNGHITIRRAHPEDAEFFVDLVLLSAPTLFPDLYGAKVRTVLTYLFQRRKNLFSYQHVYFSALKGQKIGMILGYDWKTEKRESLRTGFLLMRNMKLDFFHMLPNMIKAERAVDNLEKGEFYISNIATLSPHRCLGIGTKLIQKMESIAKESGNTKLALVVEKDNLNAITFYKGLGFLVVRETSFRPSIGNCIDFYKMCKPL